MDLTLKIIWLLLARSVITINTIRLMLLILLHRKQYYSIILDSMFGASILCGAMILPCC